jgi:hypothetical protein
MPLLSVVAVPMWHHTRGLQTRGGRQEAGPALDARMSVVGLLSRHPRADMRAAAARLLRQFTELQVTSKS